MENIGVMIQEIWTVEERDSRGYVGGSAGFLLSASFNLWGQNDF